MQYIKERGAHTIFFFCTYFGSMVGCLGQLHPSIFQLCCLPFLPQGYQTYCQCRCYDCWASNFSYLRLTRDFSEYECAHDQLTVLFTSKITCLHDPNSLVMAFPNVCERLLLHLKKSFIFLCVESFYTFCKCCHTCMTSSCLHDPHFLRASQLLSNSVISR